MIKLEKKVKVWPDIRQPQAFVSVQCNLWSSGNEKFRKTALDMIYATRAFFNPRFFGLKGLFDTY